MTQQPPPPAVQITSIFKVPALAPERLGQEDLLVQYTIKGSHVFTLRIDTPNATSAQIENLVRADAARFLPLIGKTLQA